MDAPAPAAASLRGWRLHAALLLPAAIFFAPLLTGTRALFWRDNGLYFFPHKALIALGLHQKRLPQWNPGEYGGLPLLADPNFNFFHPLALLTALLPETIGFSVFVVLHAVAAAFGAYALARSLGLGPTGAVAAGLCYAWSGPVLSFIESGQLVASCVLPWLCAAAVHLEQERTPRALALCAAAAALVFVAGTPEVGVSALALGGLLSLLGPGRPARSRATSGLLFAAAVGLGALAAAAQLLPAAAYLRGSTRGVGFTFEHATSSSLPPLRLFGIAIPFFLGAADAPGATSWLSGDLPYVQEIYAGGAALLLAVLGLRGRGRPMALLAACAALLLLAFGRYTPLYRLLWDALPALRAIRFPEKFAVPLALPIACLAGRGLQLLELGEGLPSPSSLRRLGVVAGVLALGAFGLAAAPLLGAHPFIEVLGEARALCLESTAVPSLALELLVVTLGLLIAAARRGGHLHAEQVTLAAGALLALDLGASAARLHLTVPARELTRPSPLIALLDEDANAPRWSYRYEVQSHLLEPELELMPSAWGSRPEKVFRARQLALYGAAPSLFGLQQARGYSGLTPAGGRALFQHPDPRGMLDLLSVRYGIQLGSSFKSFFPELGFTLIAQAESGLVRVFKNPSPGKMLALFGQALLDASPLAPLRCAGKPIVRMDPADAAALPSGLPTATTCAQLAARDPAEGATARITSFQPERVEADVETPVAAVALLSQGWDSGWRLQIDGTPSRSLAAFGALRAAAITPGQHHLIWTYETPGLRTGALVSVAGLAVLLLLTLLGRSRRLA